MNKKELLKNILLIILKAIIGFLYCIMLIGGGFVLIIFALTCLYGNEFNLDKIQFTISVIFSGVIGAFIDYLVTKLQLRK